jgi:hypothetical protein
MFSYQFFVVLILHWLQYSFIADASLGVTQLHFISSYH